MMRDETLCALTDDDDVLALLALGEAVDAATVQHVQGCARCRERLEEYRRVVTAGRAIDEDDWPHRPPDDLWLRISTSVASGVDETPPSDDPVVVPLRRRRTSAWIVGLAAASVGVLVGAGIVWLASSWGSAPQVVASTQLSPMNGFDVSGSAALQSTSDGMQLAVSLPDLPAAADGYYEVWVATSDTKNMVAVGTFNPDGQAVFPLPSGMDPASFPVVDISFERFDGDPGHSAVSVARGTF